MLLRCCTQYASKYGKLSSGHRIGKFSFHSSAKECSNYHTIALISHASKVMLKILQARLQKHRNQQLPDIQPSFRKKQRKERSNWQHPLDHKNEREFQKNIYFSFIDYAKAFDHLVTNKLEDFLKICKY